MNSCIKKYLCLLVSCFFSFFSVIGCSNNSSKCDVLFYGDSITARGNFSDYFPDLNVINYGFGGATIEDLISWVPRVNMKHPTKIFVLAGGNNLNSTNLEECVDLYRNLLESLLETCSYSKIYVESMLPIDKQIGTKYNCPNNVIKSFNERIELLAQEYELPYIDIYPAYESGGGLKSELTEDGVHLKSDAYGPWVEIVRPYIESDTYHLSRESRHVSSLIKP